MPLIQKKSPATTQSQWPQTTVRRIFYTSILAVQSISRSALALTFETWIWFPIAHSFWLKKDYDALSNVIYNPYTCWIPTRTVTQKLLRTQERCDMLYGVYKKNWTNFALKVGKRLKLWSYWLTYMVWVLMLWGRINEKIVKFNCFD